MNPKKYTKSPIFLGTFFTVLLFGVHFFFSCFVDNKNIIIFLRPIRDFLFFPFFLLVENVFEIYCWLAVRGLGDYGRCIMPTGKGLNMPIGEPAWFQFGIFALALIVITVYYMVIFKVILFLLKYLKNRFKKSDK